MICSFTVILMRHPSVVCSCPLRLVAVPGAVVAEGDVTSLIVLAFHRAMPHPGDTDCSWCQISVIQAELFYLASHYF